MATLSNEERALLQGLRDRFIGLLSVAQMDTILSTQVLGFCFDPDEFITAIDTTFGTRDLDEEPEVEEVPDVTGLDGIDPARLYYITSPAERGNQVEVTGPVLGSRVLRDVQELMANLDLADHEVEVWPVPGVDPRVDPKDCCVVLDHMAVMEAAVMVFIDYAHAETVMDTGTVGDGTCVAYENVNLIRSPAVYLLGAD